MRLTNRTMLASVVLSLALACGGSEEGSLSGSWAGVVTQDTVGRSGTIRLDLTQSGTSLAGRWEITFPPDLSYDGMLNGSVTGSTVSARLTPDDSEICPYEWAAGYSQTRIEGSYESFDCRVEISGGIDVRRQ